jgi:hypothetical protein
MTAPRVYDRVRVVVRYVSPLGRHEAFSFVVQMGAGNPLSLTLGKLDGLKTFQQREHFRAFASLPLELAVVEAKIEELKAQIDVRALSIDVSAGGLRVDTRLAVGVDDRLRVLLRLPKDLRTGGLPDLLSVEARVVRSDQTASDQFRVAMQSRFARELERDKWAQLTLNLQCRKV